MRVLFVYLTGLALATLVACGGDKAVTPTAPMRPTPPPMAQATPEEGAMVSDKEYRYEPEGKTDPFESFITVKLNADAEGAASPLERFALSQLIVTGIIWQTDNARALVEDPAGKGYIVGVGAAIGKNKGRIIGIDDNRVLVKETYVDFHDQATTKEVEMYLYDTQGG